MTRDEKMAIAKKIAEYEKRASAATNQSEIDKALAAMAAIVESITDFEDMDEIDGMVQSLLNS